MSKYRKEIEAILEKDFNLLNDELFQVYTDAVREIKKELKGYMAEYGDLNYSQRLYVSRMTSLLLQMENQVDFLAGVQEEHMFKHLDSIAYIAYNELFYEFEQLNGFAVNFATLPTDILHTIINVPIASIKLSDRLNDGVVPELKRRLQEVLFTGFAKGDSYQKMARRLSEAAAMSYRRTLTIARTEGGRVTGITRQMSQEEGSRVGIKAQKRWVATFDHETRNTHRELDGQTVDVKSHFEVDGKFAMQPNMFGIAEEDINCRCRTINVIEGYEPTIRRDNLTGEEVSHKNYNEWLKSKEEPT